MTFTKVSRLRQIGAALLAAFRITPSLHAAGATPEPPRAGAGSLAVFNYVLSDVPKDGEVLLAKVSEVGHERIYATIERNWLPEYERKHDVAHSIGHEVEVGVSRWFDVSVGQDRLNGRLEPGAVRRGHRVLFIKRSGDPYCVRPATKENIQKLDLLFSDDLAKRLASMNDASIRSMLNDPDLQAPAITAARSRQLSLTETLMALDGAAFSALLELHRKTNDDAVMAELVEAANVQERHRAEIMRSFDSDGLPGPKTLAAIARLFVRWRDAEATESFDGFQWKLVVAVNRARESAGPFVDVYDWFYGKAHPSSDYNEMIALSARLSDADHARLLLMLVKRAPDPRTPYGFDESIFEHAVKLALGRPRTSWMDAFASLDPSRMPLMNVARARARFMNVALALASKAPAERARVKAAFAHHFSDPSVFGSLVEWPGEEAGDATEIARKKLLAFSAL